MNESHEDDQRVVQEMIGRFDSPFFIRRAKLVETTWSQLMTRASRARLERLEFVRLRLGQMYALAGGWEALRAWLPHPDDFARLQRLHEELQPRLRMPLQVTTSRRVLRAVLREVLEAMEIFNQRWSVWLARVDLQPINKAREDYNRFYLLEKECALGSARVARIGFQRLAPATLDDLAKEFPLLELPRFVL